MFPGVQISRSFLFLRLSRICCNFLRMRRDSHSPSMCDRRSRVGPNYCVGLFISGDGICRYDWGMSSVRTGI